MWRRLRGRQISGVKFRRQVPIGPYIVDFISYDPRIVVELDGSQHAEAGHSMRDAARDRWLRSQGFAILRFWDTDVLTNIEAVLSAILNSVERCRGR
jgi:very-short-patch-repair endonuclease